MQATLWRIPVGFLILGLVLGASPFAIPVLAVFVAWDCMDGVWARRIRGESALRRAIDGTIDRTFACLCLTAGAVVWQPEALVPVMLLVARECVVGANNCMLLARGVVFSGVGVHRLTSVGQALLGVVLITGPSRLATTAAWLVTAMAYATYWPYRKAQREVLGANVRVRGELALATTRSLRSGVEYTPTTESLNAGLHQDAIGPTRGARE